MVRRDCRWVLELIGEQSFFGLKLASLASVRPYSWSAILLFASTSSILSLISVAFLAIVVAIILTPGFQDVLLSLPAAVFPPCLNLTSKSLWSVISLFFIYLVTHNRGFEHWICTHLCDSNQLTFTSAFMLWSEQYRLQSWGVNASVDYSDN